MDIPVKQLPLVERALMSMHLSLDITWAEIENEQPFQSDASFLDPTGQDDEYDDNRADGNHQGITEAGKIVAYIEDEGHGNHQSYQNGKEQRNTVDVALCP